MSAIKRVPTLVMLAELSDFLLFLSAEVGCEVPGASEGEFDESGEEDCNDSVEGPGKFVGPEEGF